MMVRSFSVLVLLASVAGGVVAAEAKYARLNIQAQSVRTALQQFGAQAGLQVSMRLSGKAIDDVRVAALQGTYTLEEGLRRLLANTGLTYEFVNERMVAIRPLEDKRSATGEPAGQMRLAVVEAQQEERRHGGAARTEDDQVIVEGRREIPEPFVTNADIPRTINDAQPYYIFDREELERSGAVNIEDFLKQRLTMNTIAITNSQIHGLSDGSVGVPPGNLSSVDLRGLGTDKTLVLINGRRVPGININVEELQPDVNGIPLSAVERIEVLPTSASGIYGGSAIGGVLNIILKPKYTGGQARLTYGSVWDVPHAFQRDASVSWGTSLEGGRTQVGVNLAWSDREPFLLADRVDIYKRNLDIVLANSPQFLFESSEPWLGTLPNIRNSGGTPVPADTPGSIARSMSPANMARYGLTPELPNLLPDGPLILKNGVSLGSNITHVRAGTSPESTPEEVMAGLLENAGRWQLDFPLTTQGPTGLLRPFGSTAETRSATLNLSREMLPRLNLFMDLGFSENKSFSIFSPMPTTQVLDADDPRNPFSVRVIVTVPDATEMPVTTRSTSSRMTLGALLRLPADWRLNLDLTAADSRLEYLRYMAPSASGTNFLFQNLPVNLFVDTLAYPNDMLQYFTPVAYASSSRVYGMTARGLGALPALPWGTPQLAFNLGRSVGRTRERVMTEDFGFEWEENSRAVTYFAWKSVTDQAYVETTVPLVPLGRLPLLHGVDLQVAGRTDRYRVNTGSNGYTVYYKRVPPEISYFGVTQDGQPVFSHTTYTSGNYTVGLKYQPVEELIVRLSQASAFLPPKPYQLIKDPLPSTRTTAVNDPVSGQRVQAYTQGGGNPDLKPQSSRSFNAGVIWNPRSGMFDGWRLNLEYYRIEQFEAIGSLNAQLIVDMESIYPERVVRDENGAITLVDTSLINLYRRHTEGWDFNADFSFDTALGRMRFLAMASSIRRLRSQYSLTAPQYEAAGYHPREGGAAKYKGNASFTWERGALRAAWTARYFGSYKMHGAPGGPNSQRLAKGGIYGTAITEQGSDTVPAQMYHDLYLSYTFGDGYLDLLKGVRVQLNISNLFAAVPPMDVYYQNNFLLSPYGDVRLRTWSLTINKSW